LARIQFAFTVSFHILFPAFTIGLASWLAVLEWRWLRTKDTRFLDLYRFWVRVFALAFGMGVVSGVVMSWQFGTNWSLFSDKTANVLGPLLGYEVMTAFFLESSFLGVMLFGWGRVSPRMHFVSTCLVAFGTLVSAFWILAANSWMQTPAGFVQGADGRLFPSDWFQVVFNPSFPWRLVHMLMGAFLTTAFVVGGTGALYLLQKRHVKHARLMLGMATLMAALVTPLQILAGDLHGLNTLEHQPAKVAAMEGIWETEKGAALRLFAWPDAREERNRFEITWPRMASLILTHDTEGVVRGLKSWPAEDRPPAGIVFWSFRVMVGAGLLMLALGWASAWLFFRGRLFQTRWVQISWVAMIPSGFLAILAGWFVTETGRQPWTVYGVIRTAESASPAVTGPWVAWSLAAFVLVYLVVFGTGTGFMVRMIRQGPHSES
jgi:cytochrome d ubiquinol oxidase subunit I